MTERATDRPIDPGRIAGQPYTDDLRPMTIEPVTLEGRFVRLEPLSLEHLDGLAAVGLDPALWRWTTIAVRTRADLEAWIRAALAEAEAGTSLPFATLDRATGRAIGSSRYLNVDRANRRLEIGWTWVAPAWQRSAVNSEAKLLQLEHAFERLRAIRVEFKTDSLNAASRAALAGIGAIEEGTFRNHVISQGGRLRHSTFFSVTDADWPVVRAKLRARLYRHATATATAQPARPGGRPSGGPARPGRASGGPARDRP